MDPYRHRLKASRKQEKRGAEKFGGRVTPASGALWGAKGDVRNDLELIEYKRTDKKSISIKLDWLKKLRDEAIAAGKIPYLGIEIQGEHYVLMAEEDFIELRGVHAGSSDVVAGVDKGRGMR